MNTVTLSVQELPSDITSWTSLTRRVESSGFEALLVGDHHPGSEPAPWTALGAAAAVTNSLKLGTCVLQCGAREPLDIADRQIPSSRRSRRVYSNNLQDCAGTARRWRQASGIGGTAAA